MADRQWVRTRYVALRHLETRRGVVVDMFQVRHELMKKRIFAWAEIMKQYRSLHETRMVMIMLTYRKADDWKPGHITDYLKNLKRRLGDKLIGHAWVAELQERDAVHYHVVLVVNKGSQIPLPDKSGMWPHGWSGIRTARTPFYLVTYVGKERQKDLARYPKSCRLYAASVRTREGDYRQAYRLLAGLTGTAAEVDDSGWEYAGSSVTYDYSKDVLLSNVLVK